VPTIIEPFKIKSVEPIRMTSPAERLEMLRAARYNVFQLRAEDMLTDSGTSAMSAEQWEGVMRVRGAADRMVPAWALYKMSLLYLALLFTVLAADTLVRPGVDGPAPLVAAEVQR